MKKLLILLLFIPVNTLAQDTVHIPAPAAKAIVRELVSCDSIKAIHELTVEQLTLTEYKVSLKDSIIKGHVDKGLMYEERIKNEQSKFEVQGRWVEDLRKDIKGLKVKLLYTKASMGAVILGLGYLLLKSSL